MKQKVSVWIWMIAILAIISTGCVRDHDKTIYFTPSQFDYITYDALLAYGGEFQLGHYFSLDMCVDGRQAVEISFDKKRGEKDEQMCQQVIGELEDILSGQKLHAVKMPPDQTDYDKYMIELFSREIPDQQQRRLGVKIPAQSKAGVRQDAQFLNEILLRMADETRCYVCVIYTQKNDAMHKKEYVYYTEDAQLLEQILAWADRYMELSDD